MCLEKDAKQRLLDDCKALSQRNIHSETLSVRRLHRKGGIGCGEFLKKFVEPGIIVAPSESIRYVVSLFAQETVSVAAVGVLRLRANWDRPE